MSLPLAFGTTIDTIPASVPYLHTPGKRAKVWRDRLADLRRPRIGLVWSGKTTHKNDHNRSIALSRLKPLLSVAGTQFVSLQREYRASDIAALDQLPIRRLDDLLTDFADTAAVIGELDLVIAVDTAVAHLAGAMDRQLWLLVPHAHRAADDQGLGRLAGRPTARDQEAARSDGTRAREPLSLD